MVADRPDAVTDSPTIPLFWRLFVPNACVLVVACVVLMVEPANGRIVSLVGGLAIMLAVNLLLMRRAFAPLTRLMATMNRVDPLHPGERVPVVGPSSEVTVLAREFNAMLDRIETERRESAYRTTVAEDSERRHLATEVLDELGLTAALNTLCNRLSSQTGLVIHRTLPETPPPLSADEQLVVYRIVQESLTNVVRHSGASQARVVLHADADRVEVVVVDDGRGLPAEGVPLEGGIRSMRERALLIGAELTWTTADGGGSMIRLQVPVR